MLTEIMPIILLIISIVLIVIGTSKYKINAFLVMMVVAYFYSFATGTPPTEVATVVREGFGELILKAGLIYIFGTIMGTFLEKTGAAISITKFILDTVGKKNAPLAVALSGYVVCVPITCDPGYIVLNGVSKRLAKDAGFSVVVMSVALACGLYSTHTFVPPTPGPTASASMLGADLGRVILLGLIVALVTTLVGLIFATKFCKRFSNDKVMTSEGLSIDELKLPNTLHSFLPVAFPLLAICLSSFAKMEAKPFGEGSLVDLINIIGEPATALFISVLIAFTLVPKGQFLTAASDWVNEALESTTSIVFVTAAGGAFAAALRESPLVELLTNNMGSWNLGIFMPFIIASVLKMAQGSSTVSMLTTAGIMAPLIGQLGIDPALCALAIGAGSMVVSHTNDSYFWVVSQFSGMSVSTTLKSFTLMTGVIGVTAFLVVLVMSLMNI